ncbi:MAG: FtsX-like permease family protein [Candidatus Thorarchaeota archaeon]|nr:FtsX-like permease family protein [Candidatus Thorarchaeota archaeon]
MGLRKHSNLASYAIGNILKYRTRSAAIVAALVFSTFLLGSAEFIREGVMLDITASLDEGPDIVVQRLIGGRQAEVPSSWRNNLSSITGVRIATPRVWGYFDIGTGNLLTIMGVNATDYGSIVGATGTDIVPGGRFLEETDRHKIVVGQGIVDLMGAARVAISVGSVMWIIAQNGSLLQFEVVGVFSTDASIYSYDMIITDLQSSQEVLGIEEGGFTDLVVWIDYGANLNDVAFRIDTQMPETRVLTRNAMSDMMMKTYGGRAGIIALIWIVVLMTALLLTFTVSSAGSDEARREVGLLKALGFDTVDVLEIRMIESLTLSLIGASLGVSLAIIFDFYLGAPILSGYLLGWNILLLNAGIPLAISGPTIFILYAVAVVPILVGTVVPAWRNAITEPDVVLRGV